MRKKWAEAWSSWLQPGSELVTLMFPVEAEGRKGPPWPVPTQLYDDMLTPQGILLSYLNCLPQTGQRSKFVVVLYNGRLEVLCRHLAAFLYVLLVRTVSF